MDRDSSSPHLSLHRRTLENTGNQFDPVRKGFSDLDHNLLRQASAAATSIALDLLSPGLPFLPRSPTSRLFRYILRSSGPSTSWCLSMKIQLVALASTLVVVLRAHMAFGKECPRTTKEYKPGLPILPFLTMSRRPCKKAITSLINAYCAGPLYQWLRMYFSFAASSSYWSLSSLSAFGL
jgi:hypothetical protein